MWFQYSSIAQDPLSKINKTTSFDGGESVGDTNFEFKQLALDEGASDVLTAASEERQRSARVTTMDRLHGVYSRSGYY